MGTFCVCFAAIWEGAKVNSSFFEFRVVLPVVFDRRASWVRDRYFLGDCVNGRHRQNSRVRLHVMLAVTRVWRWRCTAKWSFLGTSRL